MTLLAKVIPGDAILTHFGDKEIGASDALQGEMDNVSMLLLTITIVLECTH